MLWCAHDSSHDSGRIAAQRAQRANPALLRGGRADRSDRARSEQPSPPVLRAGSRHLAGAGVPSRHGRRHRRHAHLPGEPGALDTRRRGSSAIYCCATPSGSRPKSRRCASTSPTCEPRRSCGMPVSDADAEAEAEANRRVQEILPRLKRRCCDEHGTRHRWVGLSGYPADRRAAARGTEVRATLRSLAGDADVRAAVRSRWCRRSPGSSSSPPI